MLRFLKEPEKLLNTVWGVDVFDRVSEFREGIFDLTGVLYYLSVIFLFVFFTEKNMEKRRWS